MDHRVDDLIKQLAIARAAVVPFKAKMSFSKDVREDAQRVHEDIVEKAQEEVETAENHNVAEWDGSPFCFYDV